MRHQHVVSRPHPPFQLVGSSIEVQQVPVWQDNFTWLLVDRSRGTAAAVDGAEAAPVLASCAAQDLRLDTIFVTHTHRDHIGINRDLSSSGALSALRVVGARSRAGDIPGLSEAVGEGDEVAFGDAKGAVLSTEGHLDGHISFVFGNALFCGDTLFAGGCGYLWDGPPEKMHESLTRLAALPPGTLVCCAHEYTEDNLRFAWFVEPDNRLLAERIRDVWQKRGRGESTVPSTIGEEVNTNPFLRVDSATLRERLRSEMPSSDLSTASTTFAALRELKDRKTYKSLDDSKLPLR